MSRGGYLVGAAVTAVTITGWVPVGAAPSSDSPPELCRLPVSTHTDIGFVSYPTGTFTADASEKPSLPGSSQSSVTNFGYSYDRALSQWVPVTPNLLSPDGSEYVYGDLQVVDVKTGTERQLAATLNHAWLPIAWEPDGIYAVPVGSGGGDPGLWLISYPAGEARQISAEGYWEGVRNGAAYGIANNVPSDTSDAINRLDVSTGAVTKWFYLPGSRGPYLAGFDASGAPVIQQSVAVYVVPAALQPILVTDNTHASSAIGDKLGIWVGNSAGVFLFADGKFTRVTDLPAAPAGVCLAGSSTATPTPVGPQMYTVRAGDTLSSIARAFGLSSYRPLFWRNEARPQPNGGVLANPDRIRPGWILEIPKEPLPTYVVRGGDSLSSIAEHFYGPGHGGWWRGIYDANRDQLRNPALIYPGQKIRIP